MEATNAVPPDPVAVAPTRSFEDVTDTVGDRLNYHHRADYPASVLTLPGKVTVIIPP